MALRCYWWLIPSPMTRQAKRTYISYRRVGRRNLKENAMSKIPNSVRKELATLAARPESEIDFSDIPATTAKDWQGAVRGQFYKPIKQQLTVRVDADVVEWLKGQGRGYQSRLNQILRAAMLKNIQHR